MTQYKRKWTNNHIGCFIIKSQSVFIKGWEPSGSAVTRLRLMGIEPTATLSVSIEHRNLTLNCLLNDLLFQGQDSTPVLRKPPVTLTTADHFKMFDENIFCTIYYIILYILYYIYILLLPTWSPSPVHTHTREIGPLIVQWLIFRVSVRCVSVGKERWQTTQGSLKWLSQDFPSFSLFCCLWISFRFCFTISGLLYCITHFLCQIHFALHCFVSKQRKNNFMCPLSVFAIRYGYFYAIFCYTYEHVTQSWAK